ncbi:MAG: adenylate/guanylate cyclase domain-containing protein [Cyclobacteriaceae bacterium]
MKDDNVRQLAAVMFTDIVGYTAMMQSDEAVAIKVRKRHREVFQQQHNLHRGEIIQYYGDGSLSIFKSAIEAVQCAIAIQKLLQEGDPVPIRIGLHMGDIVFNKTEVFGDGVNFASRIESMGVAGAILISNKLNDELKNHPEIRTSSMGQFELKNIAEPVEVFAVTNEGINVPGPSELKGKSRQISTSNAKGKQLGILAAIMMVIAVILTLYFINADPTNPSRAQKSIAVLPFNNMSGDDDGYFAAGITEDILTQISNIGDLRVLSRFTLKEYKSAGKTPKQIGEELGVSNLLVGSIRRSGDKLRISCQLIETDEETETWAQIFDRKIDDVFKIQSEIALEVAENLKSKLTETELNAINTSSTQNIAAYGTYLRGRGFYDTQTPESNERAISLFKEALKLDSNYGLALAGLADAYSQGVRKFRNRTIDYLDSARLVAKRATEVQPGIPEGWKALGVTYSSMGMLEKAKENYLVALDINPNHANALNNYGFAIDRQGDGVGALRYYQKSATLQPFSPTPVTNLARTYLRLNMPDSAKKYAEIMFPLMNDEADLAFRKHQFLFFLYDDAMEAREFLIKAAEIEPDNPNTLARVANELLAYHNPELARPYLEVLANMDGYDPEQQIEAPLNISYLLIKDNQNDSAQVLLTKQIAYLKAQIATGNTGLMLPLLLAQTLLGPTETALNTIATLLDSGEWNYRLLEKDVRLATLHAEPEYQQMINNLKEKVTTMRSEVLRGVNN